VNPYKALFLAPLLLLVTTTAYAQVELPGRAPGVRGAAQLPNGWRLTPAGQHVSTSDTVLGVAVDPSARVAAAVTGGFGPHKLYLIDAHTWRTIDEADLGRSFLGVAFSDDGSLIYASGGPLNKVLAYRWRGRKLIFTAEYTVRPPAQSGNVGALLERDGVLYVLEVDGRCLTLLDVKSKEIRSRIELGGNPYAIALAPDAKTAYVSLWSEEAVAVVDLAAGKVTARWPTGRTPNDVALSTDGEWLYVSCGESNCVDVIATGEGRAVRRASCALVPRRNVGATTNALALDQTRHRLYAANAGDNCIAVIDVAEPEDARVIGFIPTGWYPTDVALSMDGRRIFASSAKGITSAPNPSGPTSPHPKPGQYTPALLTGSVSRIVVPDREALEEYTKLCYDNRPDSPRHEAARVRPADSVIPEKPGDPCPIEYVIYILKENRTYDQLLGDMPEGNGDPELAIFGEAVTPNAHALARTWVLLDNAYNDAEVSADGHPWCLGAYSTDYNEKTWPSSYAGKSGAGRRMPGDKLQKAASGYLWDLCARYGLPYRSYGEMVDTSGKPDDPGSTWEPALLGHYDPLYVTWNIEKTNEMDKAEEFLRDLQAHIDKSEVPRLMVMSLPKDHTAGTRVGIQTPRAMVAENDQALGRIVEGVSRMSIWPKTAIFVVEDDTQNGPDHVDCHREPVAVVSPWVKRGHYEPTLYSGAGIIRTIELILGLPPMTQYDAVSLPLWKCFTNKPDFTPYDRVRAGIDTGELNTASAWGAEESAALDLTALDRAPEGILNEIIWRSVKGPDIPCPPPVYSAFARPLTGEEDD